MNMLPIINHQYLGYASSTTSWLPMDTEELYAENLKKNYNELKKYKWLNCNISYNFNQHGFRSDEFSQDPSIMFLGCSFTCGIGLPYDNIWTTIVAKKLNLKQFNLGIGGSSADTAFRLGNHYIPKLKPKIVIFLQPEQYRLEIINQNSNFINLLPSVNPPLDISKFYKLWILNNQNSLFNSEKNSLALECVCQKNNIKFYKFDIDTLPKVDLARDLAHKGVLSNKLFSNIVLEQINL